MVMCQFSEAMIFSDEATEKLQSSGQHYDEQLDFDFNHSATSHLHISEAPKVTSAPNIQSDEGIVFYEDDFMEINDLTDTEPAFSNSEKFNIDLVDNLPFEFYYAEMFSVSQHMNREEL
ncbi:NAC transcription factor-like protein [Trifolium pratense]|uniref:NAC transcription factor-like protein n=1 Tax=Trifolium pratense TaxID=57577 RepID=A0A2K3M9P3_TRIPR|nr:NAC transcription factor-like protein [Trifolium pratense]